LKSTGIVRQVDDLGRIVIPKGLRKTMNIKRKASMEIFIESNNIQSFYQNIKRVVFFVKRWEILLSLKEWLFSRNV